MCTLLTDGFIYILFFAFCFALIPDNLGKLTLIMPLRNLTRPSRSSIRMRCIFRGHPTPLITWYKNEAPLEEQHQQHQNTEQRQQQQQTADGNRSKRLKLVHFATANGRATSQLRLSSADVHDTGFYKCSARSGNQTMDTVAVLRVISGRCSRCCSYFRRSCCCCCCCC